MSSQADRRRPSGELQHRAEHTRPRKSPSVLNYLVVLFMVAFFLLLIAYFQQQRQNNETTDDAIKQSTSALQSIQNLVSENETLRNEVEDLEDRLSALEDELTAAAQAVQREEQLAQTAQDRLYAMGCLNKLRYLYNNDRTAAKNYLAGLGDEASRIRSLLGEVSAASDPQDMALYDPQKSWDQLVKWLG